MEDDIRDDELCDMMMNLSARLWSLQEPLLAKRESGTSVSRFIAPRLIVPGNGDHRRISDERRISEQETRIVLCQMLDQKNSWHYSVETPTIFKFKFKGITKELSARTDMTLYGEDERRLLDIEFKQGNPPGPSIDKDIWKLLKEGRKGVWFHILKNTDHQTFLFLFEKIRNSFSERIEHAGGNPRTLLFVLCVLAPTEPTRRVAYHSLIRLGDPTTNCREDFTKLFSVSESMPRIEDGWNRVYPEDK